MSQKITQLDPQPNLLPSALVMVGDPISGKLFRVTVAELLAGITFTEGTDVSLEAAIRAQMDAALQQAIDAEVQARIAGDQNEGLIRANIMQQLLQTIAQEANARENADNNLQNQITSTGTAGAQIDDNSPALNKVYSSQKIEQKFQSVKNSHFRGQYTTLALLQAIQDPVSGDYADLNEGVGFDVARYIWDNDDEKWVKQGQSTQLAPEQIKQLYESNDNTNAFDDDAKNKLDEIQADAQKNDPNTTLQGNNFNAANQLVKLDANAKLPAIDGSALTNLPTELVWLTDESYRPVTGDASKAYISKATGLIYRWAASSGSYEMIGGGGGTQYVSATGTNTYAISNTKPLTAYPRSLFVSFGSANTGSSTIAIDSLPALSIQLNGHALAAGNIKAGSVRILLLAPDSSNYQLQATMFEIPTVISEKVVTQKPDGVHVDYDLIDSYANVIDDSAGVKTSAYMGTTFPSAVRGQKVVGKNGIYTYVDMNGIGWHYAENKIS